MDGYPWMEGYRWKGTHGGTRLHGRVSMKGYRWKGTHGEQDRLIFSWRKLGYSLAYGMYETHLIQEEIANDKKIAYNIDDLMKKSDYQREILVYNAVG